jgi:uncharacterized protein (TIGR02246 family)
MRVAVAVAVLLGAACASRPAQPAAAPGAADEVRAMLTASAASWNAGDLEGFLDDYLDAPTTAFVGGTVTRGVAEIRRRYQASYWRTGKPEQDLRFEDVDVRMLGPAHALALGRYVLVDPQTKTTEATGWFSLVLSREPTGWKIIHDHSSEAAAP